jgi:hypothetical protein
VVKRKNMNVQEMARTMLNQAKLSDIFCRDAFYTTVYILNREQLQAYSGKNPYELWKGIPTNVKHLKVFGRKCYIKRGDDNLVKFDSICDEDIFLG